MRTRGGALTFCGPPGEKQREQTDHPGGSFSPQIHGEAAEGPVSAGGETGRQPLFSSSERGLAHPGWSQAERRVEEEAEAAQGGRSGARLQLLTDLQFPAILCVFCDAKRVSKTLIFAEHKVEQSHILDTF